MKLSEAIMMGRHLVDRPRAFNLSTCALGMALGADGYELREDMGTCQDYQHIIQRWPWLETLIVKCPACSKECMRYGAITHVFDAHVMTNKTMTLEQLCDWVKSVEPAEIAATANDSEETEELSSAEEEAQYEAEWMEQQVYRYGR